MTRNTVQDTASLHEKAVQAVAKGSVPTKRRKARRSPSMVQPTYQSPLVHEEVWAAAKKILDSGHGYTKWSINSETEVVVR